MLLVLFKVRLAARVRFHATITICDTVERLLEFIPAEAITGEALCGLIILSMPNVRSMPNIDLNIQLCRSQTMDGTGNISGKNLGCAAQFTSQSPRVYHYCAIHNLNLVLCKSCKIPEIQSMHEALKQPRLFFRYLPRRRLEKAVDDINGNRNYNKIEKKIKIVLRDKVDCKILTTLESFVGKYEPIISCLEAISYS